ncbi:RNA 2',3'-cyclic phosphodiesterase [Marimonas arenosa]|uniref:RNA 2',3'-cyclic phosphodiesterase n=1 Tax=Marimonas arenosa TaxID=1795305 RepID=A0AAE3WF50_9RHOB|nr:RNA 2',3'-cyclic phosphodiesterase [Marimonas arenosa]MDQ2091871.1 RNA 2',3'-cyclic phosphodiesterase [Marimonas arenosa]
MRAFIAVDLPEALRAALEQGQEGLPGRPVPSENLHLTLAFLGEVAEPVLHDVHEGLSGLRLTAPELRVSELDVFGGRRPNLCFAAVAMVPDLEAAQRAVVRVCRAAGVDLRRERFRPHVTLARFGRELGRREAERLAAKLGVVHLPPERAESFSLCRSDLRPEGPVYSMLAQYEFTADPEAGI